MSIQLLYIIISFLIALPVHESAHGLVAKWLGDPTSSRLGRITLNPLPHLDPMGTLLIFFVGFGWGRPVPVDDRYFRHKTRDNALVAIAGPISNFLIAALAMVLLKHFPINPEFISFLQVFISLNLILAVFNLIPVPPLDGSHILEFFLPKSLIPSWMEFQKMAPFLLLAVLLAEHFFHIGLLTGLLRFCTDVLYVFLFSVS